MTTRKGSSMDQDLFGQSKLYERVAARIVTAIESGALRPGDRLPSVRRLSQQERVSVSTVLQTYVHLESLGLLETRPQSGHYVRAHERTLPDEPQVAPASLTVT